MRTHMLSFVRTVTTTATLVSTIACSNLFDVSDPTLIRDSDIANKGGADALRLGVFTIFNRGMQGSLNFASVFSDELQFNATPVTYRNYLRALDRRDTTVFLNTYYGGWGEDAIMTPLTAVLSNASLALPNIRQYADTAVRGDYIAQIYAMRGWAIVQMAEYVCPGFPINDIRDGLSYYSAPYSTDSAFRYAVATIDTALKHGRDSSNFINFARILKGRALINLGEYQAAATAVRQVPTAFQYATFSYVGNAIINNDGITAMGDREGGVGLPYVTDRDPRLPMTYVRMRIPLTGDPQQDSLYGQRKYTRSAAAVTVASGIEARLIEAEAALNAHDSVTWLAKLNDLRATAITPALPPLNDPGAATRLDTLFKERAYWMYLTGHRLGDMRRLVKRYGRSIQSVYPQGGHSTGGIYESPTSIPFKFDFQAMYNPKITKGCGPE